MARFAHDGGTIYYEESGSGQPLLLIPGWAGTIDDLSLLRQALVPRFRVIAADPPGSGKSQPQPRRYTPSYFQDDASVFLAMLEALSASPSHVVGFSDGGEYALLIAGLKPAAVRSVVTWGAAGKLANVPEMADALYNVADDPIPPLEEFAEYMKATYGEVNARIMAQTEAVALKAMMAAGGDISFSLAAGITCPALLVTGEHDPFAPPPLVREMADAIAEGEFIEAKGAGHDVHHARQDWFVETVTAWLSRHQ